MRKLKSNKKWIYLGIGIIILSVALFIYFKPSLPTTKSESIETDDCKDLEGTCTEDNTERYIECAGSPPNCKCTTEPSNSCKEQELTDEEKEIEETALEEARKEAEERREKQEEVEKEEKKVVPEGDCDKYKNAGECEKGICDFSGQVCSWNYDKEECDCQGKSQDCRSEACESGHCEYDSCGGSSIHQLSGDLSCMAELSDRAAVCCCEV